MWKKKYSPLTKNNIVDFIAEIFERCGDEEYLGEPVTMAEHMLQGANFAQKKGCSKEIIVAALLHDIGHFTGELGSFTMEDKSDRYHEVYGANILERFFPPVITDCIRYHVAAKRYLCATQPEYFEKLSEASVRSLKLQGGPMSKKEVMDFQKNPNLEEIIQVRYFDDEGKVPGMVTPPFDHFAPIVQDIVDAWHTSRDASK